MRWATMTIKGEVVRHDTVVENIWVGNSPQRILTDNKIIHNQSLGLWIIQMKGSENKEK